MVNLPSKEALEIKSVVTICYNRKEGFPAVFCSALDCKIILHVGAPGFLSRSSDKVQNKLFTDSELNNGAQERKRVKLVQRTNILSEMDMKTCNRGFIGVMNLSAGQRQRRFTLRATGSVNGKSRLNFIVRCSH